METFIYQSDVCLHHENRRLHLKNKYHDQIPTNAHVDPQMDCHNDIRRTDVHPSDY